MSALARAVALKDQAHEFSNQQRWFGGMGRLGATGGNDQHPGMIMDQAVALSPILPMDLPQLLLWSDDPAIARYNEPYIPKNADRERDFWLNSSGDTRRVFFAIRARPDPAIIGHVQIMDIQPIHRSASLGVLIGRPENRGKGHGRAAMQLAIAYCWRHLNLSRLSLSVHASNAAAIALYEKLGFAIEGTLRQAQFIDGDWVDLHLMALMRADR